MFMDGVIVVFGFNVLITFKVIWRRDHDWMLVLITRASNDDTGEPAHMRRLACVFAAQKCDKYLPPILLNSLCLYQKSIFDVWSTY